MAADHNIGFAPTRRAISPIAKEGVFLGLITQRPAELDPTILSQCNERDQSLLRSAVADTAANLLAFLPSLGNGKALAFGEGVALPTRLKFKQLPDNLLPKSETVNLGEVAATSGKSPHSLASVVERWRGRIGEQPSLQRPAGETASPSLAPVEPGQPALDPNRFRLLKRPLDQQVLNAGRDKTIEPSGAEERLIRDFLRDRRAQPPTRSRISRR